MTGARFLTQNMKGLGDMAGKVTGAIMGGGDSGSQSQNEKSGESNTEPFTHVLDSGSLAACMAAMKLQQKVYHCIYMTYVLHRHLLDTSDIQLFLITEFCQIIAMI